MNIQISLLVIGALVAGNSSAAQAVATKPLDPDKAPIAAVDRFSDKAANIQVRTPDNHLPGPNEPVDFDTGPFITQGLSPSTGKPVRYTISTYKEQRRPRSTSCTAIARTSR
ncbi:MAG: hypothetical protein WBE89_16005 [Methyloceanibacter sp.]